MANIEKRISSDGKVSYRVKVRLKGYPMRIPLDRERVFHGNVNVNSK